MQHECRITVLETKCFPDLQEKYLADPKSGPSRSSSQVILSCSNEHLLKTISTI